MQWVILLQKFDFFNRAIFCIYAQISSLCEEELLQNKVIRYNNCAKNRAFLAQLFIPYLFIFNETLCTRIQEVWKELLHLILETYLEKFWWYTTGSQEWNDAYRPQINRYSNFHSLSDGLAGCLMPLLDMT